jgi:hypothetical protein
VEWLFAGVEPAVRAHVTGTHPYFAASVDSFYFHRHVLRHLDAGGARDYRWVAKVNDALKAADEYALKLYIQTRMLGHDAVGSDP